MDKKDAADATPIHAEASPQPRAVAEAIPMATPVTPAYAQPGMPAQQQQFHQQIPAQPVYNTHPAYAHPQVPHAASMPVYGQHQAPMVPGVQQMHAQHVPMHGQQMQAQHMPMQGQQMQMSPGYVGGKFGFVQNRRNFIIKQRFEMLEAAAGAVGFGCVEQKNKYDIYDSNTGEALMHVKEDSGMCMRCCCEPNHEAKLFVYDMRHPEWMRNPKPKTSEPHPALAMTVDKPFKFNCCVCMDICKHEQTSTSAFDGSVIGHASKVFPCGGFCTPDIEVKDASDKVYANVTGPFLCVGGLVELCSSISFPINQEGEVVGTIKKQKPKGMQAIQEAVGDADTFFLSLPPKMDDQNTANFIATVLLMDYIFFEGGAPFEYNPLDQSCKINCFNCYCFGCLYACHCNCGGAEHNDNE